MKARDIRSLQRQTVSRKFMVLGTTASEGSCEGVHKPVGTDGGRVPCRLRPRLGSARRPCDVRSVDGRGWLGNLDSNQDKQSQSLLCYRYTIPQRNTQNNQYLGEISR